SSRRVPAPFRSSGRTVRGEEFVTLPRLHPGCPAYILTANVLPRSTGRIKRVLTFGAAAREEGGERAPGTQKSRIEVCKEAACGSRAAAACHLVGSVLRSRSKGEKEPHA
ncbi:unnamed protein product, partial [Staurois parvus]